MLTHKVRLQNISDTLNTWRVCLFYFKSFGLLSSSSFMIWMFKLLVKRVLVYGYFGEKFWKHFALFSYNFWERGFIFVVICATYIDDGQPTCVVIRKMFCGILSTSTLWCLGLKRYNGKLAQFPSSIFFWVLIDFVLLKRNTNSRILYELGDIC